MKKYGTKSVIISIQPYYVFLIIAHAMGWDIPQEKTIEVRKSYPKDKLWNRIAHIYCGKNRKSFKRIPKQYQPFMKKLLGKVIGEFVCDEIKEIKADNIIQAYYNNSKKETCINDSQLYLYANGKPLYGWHISDLFIYDKPKELGEFYTTSFGKNDSCFTCANYPTKENNIDYYEAQCRNCENAHELFKKKLTRPIQSWGYVNSKRRRRYE